MVARSLLRWFRRAPDLRGHQGRRYSPARAVAATRLAFWDRFWLQPALLFLALMTLLALPASAQSLEAPVVRVVDGDTVDVWLEGRLERVRLIGIDTPESVDPRRPVQCYGIEASERARELLLGETVQLEFDPSQGERDRYGRLLAYIWLPDGTMFNKLMVLEGYAFEYTYQLPYAYQEEFRQAQAVAQEQQLGLWAPDTCDGLTGRNVEPGSGLWPESGYLGPFDPLGPDRDCSDFSSWQEAQAFFIEAGGPERDPHRLDSDRDGIACESLPGAPRR